MSWTWYKLELNFACLRVRMCEGLHDRISSSLGYADVHSTTPFCDFVDMWKHCIDGISGTTVYICTINSDSWVRVGYCACVKRIHQKVLLTELWHILLGVYSGSYCVEDIKFKASSWVTHNWSLSRVHLVSYFSNPDVKTWKSGKYVLNTQRKMPRKKYFQQTSTQWSQSAVL